MKTFRKIVQEMKERGEQPSRGLQMLEDAEPTESSKFSGTMEPLTEAISEWIEQEAKQHQTL